LSKSEQIDSAKFGDSATFSSVAKAQARHLEAAGNIDITKKIEYLIPTTCLSDVRVFEAKS
jgi:hypothetical protein